MVPRPDWFQERTDENRDISIQKFHLCYFKKMFIKYINQKTCLNKKISSASVMISKIVREKTDRIMWRQSKVSLRREVKYIFFEFFGLKALEKFFEITAPYHGTRHI